MRVERVEGILAGSVFPVYRKQQGTVSELHLTRRASEKARIEKLYEKATSNMAQMLTTDGKTTYGRQGMTKDYDDMIGRIIDEKV